MPIKKRHQVISLGTVDGNSVEVDASSADWAIVMVKNGGSSNTVGVEASPQPFGESPTWYDVGVGITVTASQNWAWPIPGYGYSQQYAPGRMRITTSESAEVWVELVREIE